MAPRQTERATGEVWRRCLSLIWRQGHGLLICKMLCLVIESQHRVLKGLDLLFLGVELLTHAAECLIRSTHLSVHDANAPLQDLVLPCQLRVRLVPAGPCSLRSRWTVVAFDSSRSNSNSRLLRPPPQLASARTHTYRTRRRTTACTPGRGAPRAASRLPLRAPSAAG